MTEEQKQRKKEYNRNYGKNLTEEQKQRRKEYYRDYVKNNRKTNRENLTEEQKQKVKEQKRKWYQDNKERVIENSKKRYYDNKEAVSERNKQWYQDNRETKRERNKKWYQNNKEAASEYQRKWKRDNRETVNKNIKFKRENDPLFKLKSNISKAILKTITRNGYKKKSKTVDILGMDGPSFKQYLENQFEPWMNWDNYGKYKRNTFNHGWDIDHIIPVSSATSEEEIIKLNHYTNLRPLCSKMNRDVKKATHHT